MFIVLKALLLESTLTEVSIVFKWKVELRNLLSICKKNKKNKNRAFLAIAFIQKMYYLT